MSATAADRQLDLDTRQMYQALSDLVRLYQFRDRDRICCHDVSVTQCYALDSLVRRGRQSLGALAEELYLDKSTASRVIDALERKGYVRRDSDPGDARALRLSVTAEGRRLQRRIEDDILREERALLADFPPAVRQAMTELLRRLALAAAGRAGVAAPSCCATA